MALPIPAIQYTKALATLVLMEGVLEVWMPTADDTAWGRQLRKVKRWHEACAVPFRDITLSKGAARDFYRTAGYLDPLMDTEKMDGEARAQRWAALWWTALTEITSVRVICPVYCRTREWAWLEQTACTIAMSLVENFPGCDEEGTKVALELP